MLRRSITALRSGAYRFSSSAADSAKIEKEKALAVSAYLLIRYYKSRGHEESEIDPLSKSSHNSELVNFKEFGKVLVKNKLENDLANHNILSNKSLDEPFSFPSDPIFQQRTAVPLPPLSAS